MKNHIVIAAAIVLPLIAGTASAYNRNDPNLSNYSGSSRSDYVVDTPRHYNSNPAVQTSNGSWAIPHQRDYGRTYSSEKAANSSYYRYGYGAGSSGGIAK